MGSNKNNRKRIKEEEYSLEFRRIGEIDIASRLNERIYAYFLCTECETRLQRDQVTKFMTIKMSDKGFSEEAKLFGATQSDIENIQKGRVYKVALDIKPYEKSHTGYSCIVYNIEETADLPVEVFLDWAEQDELDKARESISRHLQDIRDTVYGVLAYQVIQNNWSKFYKGVAGIKRHHTRFGDLMIHSVDVLEICSHLEEHFNSIYDGDKLEYLLNRPLLVAAAILHDIGKVEEILGDEANGEVAYAPSSVLENHSLIGSKLIDDAARQLGIGRYREEIREGEIDLDEVMNGGAGDKEGGYSNIRYEEECITLLKHCVLAHSGELEYGAAIVPAVPEAMVLHYADQLSAKMNTVYKILPDIQPGEARRRPEPLYRAKNQ